MSKRCVCVCVRAALLVEEFSKDDTPPEEEEEVAAGNRQQATGGSEMGIHVCRRHAQLTHKHTHRKKQHHCFVLFSRIGNGVVVSRVEAPM